MANPSVESSLYPPDIETTRAQIGSSDAHRLAARPSMQTDAIDLSAVPNVTHVRTRQANGHRPDANTRRSSLSTQEVQTIGQSRTRQENGYVQPHRVDVYQNDVTRSRAQANQPHRLDFTVRNAERTRGIHVPPRDDPRAQNSPRSTRYEDRSIYHERSRSHNERNNFRGVSSATTNRSARGETDDRYVVPAMPMPIAVICCILNFLVPGFGSMLAAVCVFCCARTDDMTGREKLGSCCTVFGIGVLQLLLVACFLIGWIWSCIWGITFIGMSASYYDADDDDQSYDQETDRHRGATNNPAYNNSRQRGRTPLPAPQVVVDQPFPGVRYEDIRHREGRTPRQHRSSRPRRSPRMALTPSNLIYPMRAPSNIAYNSPPPPYRETDTPLPGQVNHSHSNGDLPPSYHRNMPEVSGSRRQHRNIQTAETIHEEDPR